jgi:hypothetical protein
VLARIGAICRFHFPQARWLEMGEQCAKSEIRSMRETVLIGQKRPQLLFDTTRLVFFQAYHYLLDLDLGHLTAGLTCRHCSHWTWLTHRWQRWVPARNRQARRGGPFSQTPPQHPRPRRSLRHVLPFHRSRREKKKIDIVK